jgi:hypothetical protein
MRKIAALELFIGTWNTSGALVDGSGTLIATDIYRWLPGKQFIAHDVDARLGDHVTRSLEIIGWDARRKTLFSHSFDDQGSHDEFTCSLVRRRWQIHSSALRFDGGFSSDAARLTGTWDMKRGRAWKPWLEIELRRAD